QLPAPLVEAPRSYPEFSCQLTDIFASLHPCDGHSLKFPVVSLSLHCGFLSRKLCPILCATSRVHSTTVDISASLHSDAAASSLRWRDNPIGILDPVEGGGLGFGIARQRRSCHRRRWSRD